MLDCWMSCVSEPQKPESVLVAATKEWTSGSCRNTDYQHDIYLWKVGARSAWRRQEREARMSVDLRYVSGRGFSTARYSTSNFFSGSVHFFTSPKASC